MNHYSDWKTDVNDTKLVLYKLSSDLDRGTGIEVAVTIDENFEFSVTFHTTSVGTESTILKDIHPLLNSGIPRFNYLPVQFSQYFLCSGKSEGIS